MSSILLFKRFKSLRSLKFLLALVGAWLNHMIKGLMELITKFVTLGVTALPTYIKSHPGIYKRRESTRMMKDALIVEKRRYRDRRKEENFLVS
jgi:hypothetical protein